MSEQASKECVIQAPAEVPDPPISPEDDQVELSETTNIAERQKCNQLDEHKHEKNKLFQIVWAQLSYEVHPSTYDRALNWTTGLLQTIRGGRSLYKFQEPVGSGSRKVFEDLNGYIKSGELTAILGPSGAGKTSLLNAICGTRMGPNYRGQIQLVDWTAGKKRRMRVSIIPQRDYLMENLTVRENLLFSSKILNPTRDFDHEAQVARVVEMLNLSACYHSSAANISGGEYKRVSIAQELLKQPDILMLDEPTSGLDSLTCKNLIRSLVQLVDASRQSQGGLGRPIAIVVTIHQPEAEVFHMFDHIYCMAHNGRVIYDGHPHRALAHIKTHAQIGADAQNETYPGQLANPANLLIEIASNLYGAEPIERLAREQRSQFELTLGRNLSFAANVQLSNASSQASLSDSKTFAQNHSLANSVVSLQANIIKLSPLPSPGLEGATRGGLQRDRRLTSRSDHLDGHFWRLTLLLAQRDFKSTLRDPLLFFATLIYHLAVPLTMWTIYSNKIATSHGCPTVQHDLYLVSVASNKTVELLEDMTDQLTDVSECSYMFFLSTYCFSICSLCVPAMCFPLNMQVLLRETRNGWYRVPAFVLAKTLANILFEVIFPAMSVALIYWALGMPASPYAWRMWALCLTMAFVSMISTTQGLIFGALCMDNVQTAVFLSCASTLPQAMISGFIARLRLMPLPLQWASWLSQYRYSSELTTMIRYGFGICPCSPATDEYLRSHKPILRDLPAHMERIFVDVLVSGEEDFEAANLTIDGTQVLAGRNESSQMMIPGVNYNFSLQAKERRELLGRMDSGEVHLFDALADMISRAFTYGRKLDGCPSVVSQIASQPDTLSDDKMPFMFLGLLGLLLAFKLILYFTVNLKVASRI